MRIILVIFCSILFTVLESCSSLRKATKNNVNSHLSAATLNMLDGKYNASADTIKHGQNDLTWYIFDYGYSPKSSLDYYEIKVLSPHSLRVSHYDSLNLIRSRVFKGKIKNGYFLFRRRLLFIPAIFVNLYRDRSLRIGLNSDNNLIADYNQISFMTVFVIIPGIQVTKEYNMKFKRIE